MTIPVKFNDVDEYNNKIKHLEQEITRLKSIIHEDSSLSGKLDIVESLRSVEERLKNTQSVGKIGDWEYIVNKNVFRGSEEAFRIFELKHPKDELIDISAIKKVIHADDKSMLEIHFKKLLDDSAALDVNFRINVEKPAGTREIKHIKLRAQPYVDLSKNLTRIIGIVQDVTETKKYERELIKARQKAEESDKLKTAFLANMSHEIRTPMNAIIGFSELLNMSDTDTEKRKEYADIIKNKGTLLMKLIDDIIEVSKFESGNINIHKSKTNLHHLLNELHTQFEQRKKQKGKDGINLTLSLPGKKTPVIYTDPGRLQQVLSNLLNNALKFTDKGEIEFGYTQMDQMKLQFFVRDTGVGISGEKQKIIFNRFRQVENTASRHYAGGSGLGLTIAKGIVELLGGRIWVESEPQKETIFYFTIPYEDVKKESPAPGEPESKLDISSFNWKNKVILIAEDEEVNFKFLETVLHDTQVQVLHAVNGKQAVELCKSITKIDLVLMDIKMPILNGYDATREIKKMNPSIPVIAQTAFSMKDDKDKSLQVGCDDYVSKPIDIKTLLIKINRLLNSK